MPYIIRDQISCVLCMYCTFSPLMRQPGYLQYIIIATYYNSVGDWLKLIKCIQDKVLIISVFILRSWQPAVVDNTTVGTCGCNTLVAYYELSNSIHPSITTPQSCRQYRTIPPLHPTPSPPPQPPSSTVPRAQ
jgi:hypothetical protein